VHSLNGIDLVLCVKYMQYVENSSHCFVVTFLCNHNLSLHILTKATKMAQVNQSQFIDGETSFAFSNASSVL